MTGVSDRNEMFTQLLRLSPAGWAISEGGSILLRITSLLVRSHDNAPRSVPSQIVGSALSSSGALHPRQRRPMHGGASHPEPLAAAWTAGSRVARPKALSCCKELMKKVGTSTTPLRTPSFRTA